MNQSPLRIVFAGTPEFAAAHLRALLDWQGGTVIAVYTQPDRPAGRGKKLAPSAVKELALRHNLPVFQPLTLRNVEAQTELRALQPDIMVVVAYGLILPAAVLTTPHFGCINVHASILPSWRGAAPIQRAIEAGDKESGVTIMQMDEGLDTGDMLEIRRCDIFPDDTNTTLEERLAKIGQEALILTLEKFVTGEIKRIPQPHAHTYAKKILPEELIINWEDSAEKISRKIRAFGGRGAYSFIHGVRVKFLSAEPTPARNLSVRPGTIIEANSFGLFVQCGIGVLSVRILQLEGKKPLAVSEILRGHTDLFRPGNHFDYA